MSEGAVYVNENTAADRDVQSLPAGGLRHVDGFEEAPVAMTAWPECLRDDAAVRCGRTMILESVITCPHCAIAKSQAMPTDGCQFFYTCTGAAARLKAGNPSYEARRR